jgi:hypothetical protein
MVTKEKKTTAVSTPKEIKPTDNTVLLKVNVEPSDAVIKINGKAENPTSVKKGSIAVIEATCDGYIPTKLETEISATLKPKSTTRKITLIKENAQTKPPVQPKEPKESK